MDMEYKMQDMEIWGKIRDNHTRFEQQVTCSHAHASLGKDKR